MVGAGFAGSVCAERLAAAGFKVLVVERRPHIAGNAYDYIDEAGILVHKYGPHIFHTNSERIFSYLSQFTEWRPYEHRALAQVDGKLLPVPINLDTINGVFGKDLEPEQCASFLASLVEPVRHPKNSEELAVGRVGRQLYEKFFLHYTRKQWGLDPSELDPSVLARIPVRTDRDNRYFSDRYQAMPRHGYTKMFESMLGHPKITVELNADFHEFRKKSRSAEIIYTGPIDEFFGYRYGRLAYRSLEFRFETVDQEFAQPVAIINHPNEHEYTRVTEFKHLTGQIHGKSTLAYEFPRAEGDPFYPIPRPQNAQLYQRYKLLADATPGVRFVGRLATYRYLNMDQVTGQALSAVDAILKEDSRFTVC